MPVSLVFLLMPVWKMTVFWQFESERQFFVVISSRFQVQKNLSTIFQNSSDISLKVVFFDPFKTLKYQPKWRFRRPSSARPCRASSWDSNYENSIFCPYFNINSIPPKPPKSKQCQFWIQRKTHTFFSLLFQPKHHHTIKSLYFQMFVRCGCFVSFCSLWVVVKLGWL